MPQRFTRKPTRLARREGSRMMKQTGLLVLSTVILLFVIIRFGIPAIVNMAVFLGDLKASGQPIGQEDTQAPSPPTLDQLPVATASSRLDIRGYGESQASVKLYRSGTELSETIIGENGDFSFTDLSLEDGSNSFYAVATDGAGNESGQSNRVSVSYDTLAPDLTILMPADGAEFYGEAKRTIEIKGMTDAEAEVRVNDYYSVVSSDGSFSTRLRLEEGENKILITASDNAGNESAKEITVRYSN